MNNIGLFFFIGAIGWIHPQVGFFVLMMVAGLGGFH